MKDSDCSVRDNRRQLAPCSPIRRGVWRRGCLGRCKGSTFRRSLGGASCLQELGIVESDKKGGIDGAL